MLTPAMNHTGRSVIPFILPRVRTDNVCVIRKTADTPTKYGTNALYSSAEIILPRNSAEKALVPPQPQQ